MGYFAGEGGDQEKAEHTNWHRERHPLGWCASHDRAPSDGVVEGKACCRKDGVTPSTRGGSLRSCSTRKNNPMLAAWPAAPSRPRSAPSAFAASSRDGLFSPKRIEKSFQFLAWVVAFSRGLRSDFVSQRAARDAAGFVLVPVARTQPLA